jgi:pimeloyl-ACP methyl ester carboxylesterase
MSSSIYKLARSHCMGRNRVAWLAALTCALVTACGGGTTHRHEATSPRSTAAAHASPAMLPTACGSGATTFWLPGPDGGRLEANSIGSGRVAVVFLHEADPTGMCGFWPYAVWLTARYPVRAVLVNRCGYGGSRCSSFPLGDAGLVAETLPAVEWARAHGALRVSLVGASLGGGDALEAAGVIPEVAAVVDISGDGNDTGADDAGVVERLHVPALFAVAPGDRNCPLAFLHTLYAGAEAHPKQFLTITELPGTHGWDLLMDADDQPERLAPLVAAWIMA